MTTLDPTKLADALEAILLFHESGGHKGDGSLEALATAKIELAKLTSQDAPDPDDFSLANAINADREEVVGLLQRVVHAARTSGGTAGPDTVLMQACDAAEAYFERSVSVAAPASQDAPSAPPSDDVERIVAWLREQSERMHKASAESTIDTRASQHFGSALAYGLAADAIKRGDWRNSAALQVKP